MMSALDLRFITYWAGTDLGSPECCEIGYDLNAFA